ncbi:DNA mismatch repair ATPase MutS [Hokovirus HKV1]|uniref:DNA mismatch repair ATPase MutS n=1 Tax=Hokovirus HKV1 TaxID=1977638 RepID=A0A1V0SGG8_9VIRU|nr:DNA mismatch repair ATPase MutS [Hokovirus HKV1]
MDEYVYYYKKYTEQYGVNNTVILMQVGSFYEIYSQDNNDEYLDNITNLLEIKKAIKTKKNDNIIYMAGFLCIYIDNYLPTLLKANYTVIEIEQIGKTIKGVIPKREVTHIHTPGTYLLDPLSKESNFIVYLYLSEQYIRKFNSSITCCGMTAIDITTGSVEVHDVISTDNDNLYAIDEALRCIRYFVPKELLICHTKNNFPSDYKSKIDEKYIINFFDLENKNYKYYDSYDLNFKKYSYVNEYLKKIYNLNTKCSIETFKLEKKPHALLSLVLLLDYIHKRDSKLLQNLFLPITFKCSKHLLLGNDASRQLNIVKVNDDTQKINCLAKKKINCLFDLINHTKTPMGHRYLYHLLNNPILSIEDLKISYDNIETFIEGNLYIKVGNILKKVVDIERLSRKLSIATIEPYEFHKLYDSMIEIPELLVLLNKIENNKLPPSFNYINDINNFINEFKLFFNDDIKEITKMNFKKCCFNTDIINNKDYVNLINIIDNLKKIIDLENKINYENTLIYNIRDKLSSYIPKLNNPIQIKSVKKGGHYLQTTKIRAEMLKTALKDLKIINITDTFSIDCSKLIYQDSLSNKNTKIYLSELGITSGNLDQFQEEYFEILNITFKLITEYFYKKYSEILKNIIKYITIIDNIQSSASVSVSYNYCKPNIVNNNNGYIRAKQLRHPIIEAIRKDTEYIPHDISLGHSDNDNNELDGIIIYGLNSAGKSSLMKAIGISIIMAQCGLYVPATSFEFSPYDSLYARINGNDDLFKGQSSFTLEMTELDSILERTGPKTLVIGDEVCRGTDRISGTAIVTATIMKLAETKSTFIFASHLHDVAKKIKKLKNVKSFHLTVTKDEQNDTLIYDRILKEGCGETIYGYKVAEYIIKNKNFMELVTKIKDKLINKRNILTNKVSKYNNNVYVDTCQICGFKPTDEQIKNHIGLLDTHHINFQKDCSNGFVKSKPHLPMNHEANLVILCKKCHHDVHHDKLVIEGYKDTIQGKKLKYNFINNEI